MFEQAILGILQGIAEWLPVSSEGLIVLVKTKFFAGNESFILTVRHALFLHLGTFLAALIYFWKDVSVLLKTLLSYSRQNDETKKLFWFLFVSTAISGALGYGLLKAIDGLTEKFDQSGRVITLLVGLLLIITGLLELKARNHGHREIKDLRWQDGLLLGIVQGFAALPGLSRSGLTISALLLSNFNKAASLKLSFLMSLPIVLAGNIVLNHDVWVWPPESYVGLLCSFLFGLLTIHLLLKLANRINFGVFVLIFAALTIASAFV